jgi:uncharacterized hydrophobic protein (TIGR00271 family)
LRQLVPPIDREDRKRLYEQLVGSSKPNFDFFLFVFLSGVIATLGLLIDSPAVIIGAMLLAPLMSPIIGVGLASVTGNPTLFWPSASAILRGAALAILLAIALTWLNSQLPFIAVHPAELNREILARTRPSPIDLAIALAGGLAAAYALASPHLSAALPGVAIATALMPPLCTIGIGVAFARLDIAGGALLLFITNAVTIAFASMLAFFILGFAPQSSSNRLLGLPGGLLVTAVITIVLLAPLTALSVEFVQQAVRNRTIDAIVREEVNKVNGSELVEYTLEEGDGSIFIDITLRTQETLQHREVQDLRDAIAGRLEADGLRSPEEQVSIRTSQVITRVLDPEIPPTFTPTPTPGPSLTPTRTLTPSASPTPPPTSTPSLTPTHTPTQTPSPTATSTPSLAEVANTGGLGVRLRQFPEGPIIAILREGSPLIVLHGSETVNGLVWVEVVDPDSRIGWLPQTYTLIVTLTPTPTASNSPTATP